MRIGLASKPFINNNIIYNLNIIKTSLKEASKKHIDLLCFGEAYLQGFDAFTWQYEKDLEIAISIDSDIFKEIAQASKEFNVAVALGYLEKAKSKLYCSYIFIDNLGNIINNYRRVSTGWKVKCADPNYYQEGTTFTSFKYLDKRFVVGLCGDFFDDANIKAITKLEKDIVLWPLYVNFSLEDWHNKYTKEYEEQSAVIGKRVLLINSINDLPYPSFGGCIDYENGKVKNLIPMGQEGILIVEV